MRHLAYRCPASRTRSETAPNRAENIDHVCELLTDRSFSEPHRAGLFARSSSLIVYNLDAKNASRNRRMSMRT